MTTPQEPPNKPPTTPEGEISLAAAWAVVYLTREQVNAYFTTIANSFESEMDIRQSFLDAAEAVMVLTSQEDTNGGTT